MTEGLKSEALFLKSIFLRKSLRVAVTATHLPLQGRLFSAKRRTKSSSLSAVFLQYTEKRYRGKSRYLSWRRRRDSTGFQPVVFALRTVYFMSLFAPQKDGRRVRVSPNKFIYTKRKSTKEKSLCFFCEDRTIEMFLRFRCLDLNTLGTIILHYSVSVFKFFYSVISISVPPIKTTLIFAFDSTATQSNICRTT